MLSYAILINTNVLRANSEIIKSFFISFILCVVSVQAKISFSISFFLIILGYLFIYRGLFFRFKIVFLCFLIFSFSFLPSHLWKEKIFSYSFYHFFFNPLPLNIPGITEFYLRAKQYESNNFPLSLLFPTSISNITTNLGIGLLIIFFLVKENFQNKIFFLLCIVFFYTIFSLVGQKSPRFYLEIYLLSVLLFTFAINNLQKSIILKLYKKLVYLQSLYVLVILVYGTFTLFPGSLTKELNHRVLSKYAYGYNLYYWVNTVLPLEFLS